MAPCAFAGQLSPGRPGRCARQRHRHGASAFQLGARHDRGRQCHARSAARLLNRAAWAQRLERLARRLRLPLDPYAQIDELSVGERQRVEIVKCLIREPRLFVLDEPTAVLLPDEIAALLDICRRVAASGCAVVLVTHKLAEIKRAADA